MTDIASLASEPASEPLGAVAAHDSTHLGAAAAEPTPLAAVDSGATDKPRKLKRRKQEFSLSSQDLALIDVLIARARSVDHRARKSEVARAGLALLAELNTPRLVRALQALPPVRARHK